MNRFSPLGTKGPAAGQLQCHVLVVDDDPICVEEYCETVTALGYVCHCETDAAAALRVIADNPNIGIVLSDMMMPGMDGLTLLEELSSRFIAVRPLVAIIITGAASLDAAVQAMRSNAIDMLSKPVSAGTLSAALRRASARWMLLVGQFRLSALTKMGDDAAASVASGDAVAVQKGAAAKPTKQDLAAFVRSMVRSRQSRAQYLDMTLFSDPSWDILLDLTAAALQEETVPVSSVCAATQVPLSTALRHVRQLVDSGLIRRWQDPNDKRRALLELEPKTYDSMLRFLTAAWSRQGGIA